MESIADVIFNLIHSMICLLARIIMNWITAVAISEKISLQSNFVIIMSRTMERMEWSKMFGNAGWCITQSAS